jgi:hypothetical protein
MIRVITDDQERIGRWFSEANGNEYHISDMTYIAAESNGKITCATGYTCYNGVSMDMHVALKGWFNKEFIWYAFHFPFVELGIHKLIAPTPSVNVKSLRVSKHFGFILEATIKDGAPDGDLCLMTMTKEQCRYLK